MALAPGVATADVTSIAAITFTGGGDVSADGGSPVIARGICWSTNQNQTIADNKSTDGAGTGSFVCLVTNLIPGAIYYVRAYAISGVGTAYGNQITVRTSAVLPSITTNTATEITSTPSL